MKKNLLIAISVLTLVCGVCSVGAATTSDTTASGSAVTVENKHKDGERQKGDMAKVTAVTSDTITVTKAEKPEKPDNATDDTNRPEPPAKADGDTATAPEKPSANDDGTDRPEPPTKPDGDTTAPEKHSGEKGEKPEMKFSSETTTIDLSSVKIYKMGENHQKTECTYSDISADDVVTIVYADDGTTVSEIVINKAPKTEKTSTTEA
ncbi:putative uncharacterized protein [Eubacterium sp. CAG:274]|nr:putative uncharacterized protein [Eubacterium sp. CAG:274]